MRFEAGTQVRCEMTKWPDLSHWVFDGTYLGDDDHGDWIGFRAGTRASRRDVEFVAPHDHVTLVPAADIPERGWLATFWSAGEVRVYVDVATPPEWDGTTLRAVDLDLDVVKGEAGRVYIDDEDEFAEHQVSLAYPSDLIEQAIASCRHVVEAVRGAREPFDAQTHRGWLDRLAQ